MKNKLVVGAAAAALLAAGGALDTAKGGEIPATAVARVFLPIVKINAKSRTIEARITDETVDDAGEICDYDSSAPLFAKWSENAEKLTAGKSKGNVRAMHGPKAAGKLTEITFDDAVKSIDCVIKVVDDAEWEKVEEGVYTGVSLGGNYVGKKWKDADTGAWRYTVNPVEVSLVDLPCNRSATFKATGLDGVEIDKAFKPWEPDKRDVEAKALELAKAAGNEGVEAALELMDDARAALVEERAAKTFTAEDIAGAEVVDLTGEPDEAEATEVVAEVEASGEADKAATPEATDWGIEQVFQVKADGSVHPTKKDAVAQVERLQAVETVGGPDLLAAALAKAKAAVNGTQPESDAEAVDLAVAVKTEGLADLGEALKALIEEHGGEGTLVIKSMYGVGRFAELLQSLAFLQQDACWEAEYEGDNSPVPAQMAAGVRALGDAFAAYAMEEVAEMLTTLREAPDGEAKIVALAEKPEMTKVTAVLQVMNADTGLVEKVGARNSKTDARMIQTIHDHACKLGGACETEKVAPEEVTKLTEENTALKARIEGALPAIEELTESVQKLRGDLDTAQAELTKMAKEPAPMPVIQAGGTVVSRGAEAGAAPVLDAAQAAVVVKLLIDQYGPNGLAQMAVKAAQAQGGVPVTTGA